MSLSNNSRLKARIITRVEQLSLQNRRSYLFLTFLMALAGYGFFVLLPVVVFACLAFLFQSIPAANSVMDWVEVGAISLVALACILTLIRLFQFRFPDPQGLQVSRQQAPCLHDAIAEVREHYKRPSLKSVVITDQPELRIENVPRYGLPVMLSNHLVIGLPLLQTLSTEEFRCELSRVIGQYSGMSHRMTFFIYKTDHLWDVYNRALKKNKLFGMALVRWYSHLYSLLLKIIARPAIRWEELEADLCALDFINEREVFDTLKSRAISDVFLDRCYWPNVRKMVLKNTEDNVKPFTNLEKIARSALNREGRKKWLQNACRSEQVPGDILPSFRQRMENMGHGKIRSIPAPAASALEELLGDSRKNVITIIEKLWSSTVRVQWVKEFKEKCQQVEKLKELSAKSHKGILWPGEIFAYANLERKLRGTPVIKSVRKIIGRNIQNILPDFLSSRVRSSDRLNDIF